MSAQARFYVDWKDREGVVRKNLPVLDLIHIPAPAPGGLVGRQQMGLVSFVVTTTPDGKRFQVVTFQDCTPAASLFEGTPSPKG